MNTKGVIYGKDARESLKKGVDILSNAVKVTLGGQGKNVVIGTKNGSPHITKDGVSVANSIKLKNIVEDMGASLVKEAATKTLEIAGDGTTTCTVLTQSIVSKGLEAINNGYNAMDIKRGIQNYRLHKKTFKTSN